MAEVTICSDFGAQENSLSLFPLFPHLFTIKWWEYQITWPASGEICTQVKKQQLDLDMKQQTGSKLGMEYIKVVYCHPA